MINASWEFVNHAFGEGMPGILCSEVRYGNELSENIASITLRVGFSVTELDNFLRLISFEYDNGYGGQLLFGTIWYKDGTFSQRGEYDGSEWWEHVTVPEIPEELKQKALGQ